jgi:hypothetical protein
MEASINFIVNVFGQEKVYLPLKHEAQTALFKNPVRTAL